MCHRLSCHTLYYAHVDRFETCSFYKEVFSPFANRETFPCIPSETFRGEAGCFWRIIRFSGFSSWQLLHFLAAPEWFPDRGPVLFSRQKNARDRGIGEKRAGSFFECYFTVSSCITG